MHGEQILCRRCAARMELHSHIISHIVNVISESAKWIKRYYSSAEDVCNVCTHAHIRIRASGSCLENKCVLYGYGNEVLQ